MKYRIGTPLDRNPARLQVLARRNRKNQKKRTLYAASLSTLFLGLAMAANQILL